MGSSATQRLVIVIDLTSAEHPELRERIRDTVADYRGRDAVGPALPTVRFYEESETPGR